MASPTFQIWNFSRRACPQTPRACRTFGAHKFEPLFTKSWICPRNASFSQTRWEWNRWETNNSTPCTRFGNKVWQLVLISSLWDEISWKQIFQISIHTYMFIVYVMSASVHCVCYECISVLCMLWMHQCIVYVECISVLCMLWVHQCIVYVMSASVYCVCYECISVLCMLWVHQCIVYAMSASVYCVCYECISVLCMLWVHQCIVYVMSASVYCVCYECISVLCMLWVHQCIVYVMSASVCLACKLFWDLVQQWCHI